MPQRTRYCSGRRHMRDERKARQRVVHGNLHPCLELIFAVVSLLYGKEFEASMAAPGCTRGPHYTHTSKHTHVYIARQLVRAVFQFVANHCCPPFNSSSFNLDTCGVLFFFFHLLSYSFVFFIMCCIPEQCRPLLLDTDRGLRKEEREDPASMISDYEAEGTDHLLSMDIGS